MDIMKWVARFGIVLVTFLAIDMIWLVFVARKFYAGQLGFLMRDPVNWTAALIFYALFVAGVLFFVISPALEKQSLGYAVLAGALFGLMTYATYDLTNLATIKDWPLIVTIVDLAWGTTLSTVVSLVGYTAIRKWVP
jgi:uncharacterized membrane protein